MKRLLGRFLIILKPCQKNREIFLLAALTFFLIGPSLLQAQGLKKILLPYSPIGINSLPFFVGREARLFEKHGLDVDTVFVGAFSAMFQSMLSGAADMAGSGGPAVIANVLKGGDIIQVAATVPHFTQSLMVKPEIKRIEDLRGKKLGVSRLGTVTHFALQTALDRHDIKGATILQMGGQPEALAGLSRGSIDGAVLSPPQSFQMMKEGFRELVSPKDLRNLGVEFITTGVVARRSVAEKNRDTVIRLIKGTMEAVKYIIQNEAFTKKILTKYMRLTSPELLEQSYRFAVDNFAKEPFIPPAAIQSMVQQMVQSNLVDAKTASNTPVTAFYDNSYVEEIKRSGFFDELWR